MSGRHYTAGSPPDGDLAPGSFEFDELNGATSAIDLGFFPPPDVPFVNETPAFETLYSPSLDDYVPPSPSLTWSGDSDRSTSPLIAPYSPTMEPPSRDFPDTILPCFQFGELNMATDGFHFDFPSVIANPLSLSLLLDGRCGQPPFQHHASAETAGVQDSAPDVVGNANDFTFPTTVSTPPSPPQIDIPPQPCPASSTKSKRTKRKIDDDAAGPKQKRRRRQDTTPRFPCKYDCGKSFARTHNRREHEKSVHECVKPFTCAQCERSFSREFDLKRHSQSAHTERGSPRRPGNGPKPKGKGKRGMACVDVQEE